VGLAGAVPNRRTACDRRPLPQAQDGGNPGLPHAGARRQRGPGAGHGRRAQLLEGDAIRLRALRAARSRLLHALRLPRHVPHRDHRPRFDHSPPLQHGGSGPTHGGDTARGAPRGQDRQEADDVRRLRA
jgi:hypothetical protein